MSFHVGQEVTKKNADPWEYEGDGEIQPRFGVVYTVRAIEFGDDGPYLLLNEIRNTPCQYDDGFGERSFYAENFRPVIKPKAEISFTEGAPLDSHKFDNRKQRERV